MSLLLDALKKAEAEKRRRSSAFGGREPEPPAHVAAAPTPAPRAARDKVDLALEELAPAPGGSGVQAPAPEAAEPARATAETLFTAKEKQPSRRNLLLIAGGLAILLLALGGGYYVWQEANRPSLATLPRGPVATAPVLPPPAPPAVVPAPPVPRSEPVMVIEPRGGEPLAKPPEVTPPPERVTTSPQPAEPAAAPAPRPAAPPAIRVTRGETEATMDPSVSAAYESLRRGDLAGAETNYREALKADPRNRDALLGLGAVAAKAGQRDAAERYYRAALALNPRDALAVAGLLGVRGADGSTAIESRLKTLLADQPDAAFLHYSLGNHYAAQARWGEAQQAYFQAFRAEPGNPDFAFNLAVSLDQLAQNQLAAEYYRKALALAERTPAAFDRPAAAKRLRELGP